MESAKVNIKNVVKTYIQACPEEYALFTDAMDYKRKHMADQRFGTTDSDMRALYEMPETLHNMLVQNLPEAQLEWLKKGGERGLEGGRWFANTFPAFRLPEHV